MNKTFFFLVIFIHSKLGIIIPIDYIPSMNVYFLSHRNQLQIWWYIFTLENFIRTTSHARHVIVRVHVGLGFVLSPDPSSVICLGICYFHLCSAPHIADCPKRRIAPIQWIDWCISLEHVIWWTVYLCKPTHSFLVNHPYVCIPWICCMFNQWKVNKPWTCHLVNCYNEYCVLM